MDMWPAGCMKYVLQSPHTKPTTSSEAGAARALVSSVCRCCSRGNGRWKAPSESWLSRCLACCLELRCWPAQGTWMYCKCIRGAREMRFCPAHAPFLPTLTCISLQLALRYPYPRAFHLKLESSCPRIILSLVLEYPGQNYPEEDAARTNGPGSHSGCS